jgi:outer membrane protein assembly factor BamB
METLDGALARIEPDRPLRDRLVRLRESAERQIAAKRGGDTLRKLWEVPIAPVGDVEPWPGPMDFHRTVTPSELYRAAPPVVADGRLYVAGTGAGRAGAVLCVDSTSGELVWEAPVARRALSMAADGDRVFVTGQDGTVQCLAATTGEALWRHPLGVGQTGEAWCAAGDELVVVNWDQGLLCALDAQTGTRRWETDGVFMPGAPLVLGDVLLAQTADRSIIARGLEDGETLWKWDWRTVIPEGADQRWDRAGVGVAIVGDGQPVALVGAFREGRVVFLDGRTGAVLRTKELKEQVGNPPALRPSGPDVVLASDELVTGLDPDDGAVIWSLPGRRRSTSVLAPQENVRLVAGDGKLHVIDCTLGERVASYDFTECRGGLAADTTEGALRLYAVSGAYVGAWELDYLLASSD